LIGRNDGGTSIAELGAILSWMFVLIVLFHSSGHTKKRLPLLRLDVVMLLENEALCDDE